VVPSPERASLSAEVIALRPPHRAADAVPEEPAGPHLDPRCEAYIGEWLKAQYAQILEQPLPERLAEILAAIDAEAGENR
jgi:hypothetical protein